jgi:hypothetical protein
LLGGRALLAFWGSYERDANGDATREALLGAIMVAETQTAQIHLLEVFVKFVQALSK